MSRIAPRSDLSADYVRSILSYDPDTGDLMWRVPKFGRRKNSAAGCIGDRGYRLVRIDGVLYKAHRIIWLMVTGRWPSVDIDHWDEEHGNNRWSNLREATQLENNRNIAQKGKPPRSGYKGVARCNRGLKWGARITVNYKSVYLGSFDTLEAAHAAYCAAADAQHGAFANHGKG